MDDDGHSPQTCNFRHCGGDQSTPCPFVADDEKSLIVDYSQPLDCRHDWRQQWEAKGPYAHPVGFYCTRCLMVTQGSG